MTILGMMPAVAQTECPKPYAGSTMKRRHLLEIHDQAWCPPGVRDGLTDLLRHAINKVDAFGPIIPQLLSAMERSGSRDIVDLCSGGGGPWPSLLPHLAGCDSGVDRVILTDLYPNLKALGAVQALDPGRVTIENRPVSVLQVPSRLKGFRTQFNAFHHFRPDEAQAILQNAVDSREGIGIFELASRRPSTIGGMAMVSPMVAWWGTPLVRPVRPAAWFWTYYLPVLPVVFTIDGVVSCLRAYTCAELESMVERLDDPGYHWDIGVHGKEPFEVTYLIGYPLGGGGSN